jgi:hypothetical protein
LAYLEFWGVLLAVAVSQDALIKMQYSLTGSRYLRKHIGQVGIAWKEIRDLRNLAVGHSTNKSVKSNIPNCSVTGRQTKPFQGIELLIYGADRHESSVIKLGELFDRYDYEAHVLPQDLHQLCAKQL